MFSKMQAANWGMIESLNVFETFYTGMMDQKWTNIWLGSGFAKNLVTRVDSEHSFQARTEHLFLPVKAAGCLY